MSAARRKVGPALLSFSRQRGPIFYARYSIRDVLLSPSRPCSRGKKGLRSREKRFQLVMKKVYAHERKSCKRAESLKESRAGPHVVRTLCKKRRSVAKKIRLLSDKRQALQPSLYR